MNKKEDVSTIIVKVEADSIERLQQLISKIRLHRDVLAIKQLNLEEQS